MDFKNSIVESVNKRQTLGTFVEEKKTLHVGFGFNSAYVRPMGVSLTSVVVNNPGINVQAHLFTSSLDTSDISKLEALVKQYPTLSINIYDVNDEFIHVLPVRQHWPLATYFRLMMPIVLSHLENILYLDCDILCLGDISELNDFDMENKAALVVHDVDFIARKRIAALSLSAGKYFNAGIMLINIKKWNQQTISEKAFSLLCKTPDKFSFLDQDVLNVILENNNKYIDKKWNFILAKEQIPSETKLLHCVSHPKPWKISCTSKSQELFLHYETLSPWNGIPLEHPNTYKEARHYSKVLLKRGCIKDGLAWYKTYLFMKFNTKVRL